VAALLDRATVGPGVRGRNLRPLACAHPAPLRPLPGTRHLPHRAASATFTAVPARATGRLDPDGHRS
jgi:hypothetical protein